MARSQSLGLVLSVLPVFLPSSRQSTETDHLVLLGSHSDTSRRHVPDAAAVNALLGKLWRGHGDARRAGDYYVEAHKANPFIWEAFQGLCDLGAWQAIGNSDIYPPI
jgi:hypothetical protein